MPSPLLLPLRASLLLVPSIAQALQNITIDDSDSTITYTGDWRRSVSSLDFGGSHAFTVDPTAQAVVAFTGCRLFHHHFCCSESLNVQLGVGVYFYSPLWPFAITTQLSLDGGPPIVLDLQDYTIQDYSNVTFSDNGETAKSQIVWGMSGLANGRHTLRASPAPQTPYVIVDGLMCVTSHL
jgi:hypothetical protein